MASAMQRSMSYRKPVPEYIPSPPSSPLHESEQAIQEPEKDLPPLPSNWRNVVAAKISETSIGAAAVVSANLPDNLSVKTETSNIVKRESQSHLHNLNAGGDQESLNTLQNGQTFQHHVHRGRGLPTHYRPPTPPIRSQSKQSRRFFGSGDKTIDASTIYSQPNSSNYPASPASSKLYLHSMRAGGRTASLRPSPSFRTEMTMVSMNTNLSMGWSHGLSSASETGIYSSPTLFMQKQNTPTGVDVEGHDASQDYYCPDGILCGRWSHWKSGMRTWAKRVRRAFVVSK